MPLDPSIPLRAKTIDLASIAKSGVDSYNSGVQLQQRQQQIDNQTRTTDAKIGQERIKSTVFAASRLKPLLDSGDIEGARSLLERRKANLESRIANGENVNTVETDEALEALANNPDSLKKDVDTLVSLGARQGYIKDNTPSSVREFQYFDNLAPQDQQRFLDVKRDQKGIVIGGDGVSRARGGYADASRSIKESESRGRKEGDLKAQLDLAPAVARSIELAKQVGKEEGISLNELNDRMSNFPNLQKVVGELSELGQIATYTKVGQLADTARRELGLPVGKGAVARVEYISKVDNEILPLLKQTFGAAFSEKEGESLKVTLGDPNNSPEEKDAVLRSFIATKIAQIEGLKRRTGRSSSPAPSAPVVSSNIEDPLGIR